MKGAFPVLFLTIVSSVAQVALPPQRVPTPRPQPFPSRNGVTPAEPVPTPMAGFSVQPVVISLPNGMVATNYAYVAPNGAILGMVPSNLLALRTNLAANDLTAGFPPPTPLGAPAPTTPPPFTSSIPVVTNLVLGIAPDTNQAPGGAVVTNITPALPSIPSAVGSAPGTQSGNQFTPVVPPTGPLASPTPPPARRPPGPNIPRPR